MTEPFEDAPVIPNHDTITAEPVYHVPYRCFWNIQHLSQHVVGIKFRKSISLQKSIKLMSKTLDIMSFYYFTLSICQKRLIYYHIIFCLCLTQRPNSSGISYVHYFQLVT